MQKALNQKGQVLLIVVLAMVIALTVGLAVVSRSITNLRNSQQEVDSQKALSAAETGIEQVLRSGANVSNSDQLTSTAYTASVSTVSGATNFLLNGNNQVSQDDAMYIWLTPYSTDSTKLFQDTNRWTGTLNIYWGQDHANPCNNAALEVAVIWNTRADPRVTRYTYDPCSNRASKNGFASPSTPAPVPQTIAGINLYNLATISVTNGFLARVVPMYSDAYIGVNSNPATLPPQGIVINSVGQTENKTVQRAVNVFQGYPEIPAELFPFTLFWP
jgi:hypothetical protein